MSGELIAVLRELGKAPGLLKEVYGDLAKPGVTEVGKAIGNILGLGNTALWPIALANGAADIALKANLERLRVRLSSVPSTDISQVPPEVGVPLTEKMAIIRDGSIAALYVELLAKASINFQSHFVHPAFVNLVENLSPDEAYILPYFEKRLPKVDVRLVADSGTVFKYVFKNRIELPLPRSLDFPINFDGYINNLQRLGIIEISDNLQIKEEIDPYQLLINMYGPLSESIAKSDGFGKPVITKGMISPTEFGKLFIRACIPPQT